MKIQNIDWSYFFKHWIFTLLLGPFVSQVILFLPIFHEMQVISLLAIYPVVFIVSIIFSVPTYIVYAFVYYYFSAKHLSILYSKITLISIPIIGVFITTDLLDGNLWFFVACSYSISSILSGLFFNLNFRNYKES